MKYSKPAYWIITTLIALALLVTGIGNLVPFGHIAHDMTHPGYPPYFMKILGGWKILGAVTIIAPVSPKIKEWAYAGMLFDLTGAALSRYAMDDGFELVLITLLIAGLVVLSRSLMLMRNKRSTACLPGAVNPKFKTPNS